MSTSSINLGLPSMPETKDQEMFWELTRVYNALNLLASSVDTSGSASSLAGAARNLKGTMNGATATITADEVTLELAGLTGAVKIIGLNKTCVLTTVGIGGIDTGTATAAGDIAIYVIYNQVTKVAGLLATLVTGVKAPAVYSGSHLPSGYMYSGLIGVYKIGGVNSFIGASQNNRTVQFALTGVLSRSGNTPITSVGIGGTVPYSAMNVGGSFTTTSSVANTITTYLYSNANAFGGQQYITNLTLISAETFSINIDTGNLLYYSVNGTTTISNFTIMFSTYTF